MKKKLKEQEITVDEAIVIQKEIATRINKLKNFKQISVELITTYNNIGTGIALALADFKCEHCEDEHCLTIHHLIERPNKQYINHIKYFVQRKYFANLVVLCCHCHSIFHGKDPTNGNLYIPETKISKIKKKFIM